LAIFGYRALEGDLSATAGMVVADTPRQAREVLRDRGLTVLAIEPRREKQTNSTWRRLWAIRHRGDITTMIRELSTLLGVGVPLLETLDALLKQHGLHGISSTSKRFEWMTGGSFRNILLLLRERVAAGESLAQAMAAQPHVFDTMCINLAQVGEDAGNLDQSLEQLATFREKQERFKGRLISALLYPAVVSLTGIGVTIFLMTMVVPSLLSTLLEAGRPLPRVTQLVKGISDLFLHEWWLLLLGLVCLIMLWTFILSTPKGRYLFHRFLLSLPIVGELVRKQAIVHVATIISTLTSSGIVFVQAMEVVESSTKNLVIRNALRRCHKAIGAGHDIADAIALTEVFPPLVVQVFAVGQQAGKLESMLDRLAIDYDRQVVTATDRFTSILEPVLILMLAVMVGLIAFATILPILEAGNVL
jgi:type II secretory pathway component PulF